MDRTSISLLGRVCRDSDTESWQKLAAVYSPVLRGWLKRYNLQPSDADDLVQEVLLTLSRELPQFRHSGRPGAFRSWLRTILVNRLRNFWRKGRRRPHAAGGSDFQQQLNQLADPNSELSRLWDREHDSQVLAQLLKLIQPRFNDSTRQAFRRVVLEGVEAEKVADELGMTLNAVLIAKCRVLKELRREGEGLWGE